VASIPGCSARAYRVSESISQSVSGSGGIRTLSISRSEQEWSASCLPSQVVTKPNYQRTWVFSTDSVVPMRWDGLHCILIPWDCPVAHKKTRFWTGPWMHDDPGRRSMVEPIRPSTLRAFQSMSATQEIHGSLGWFPVLVTAYTRTDAGTALDVRANSPDFVRFPDVLLGRIAQRQGRHLRKGLYLPLRKSALPFLQAEAAFDLRVHPSMRAEGSRKVTACLDGRNDREQLESRRRNY
jgi:hypothetical protein